MIPPTAEPSAWSPLRIPVYRRLWVASLASNIGTWMQNVAAVWLMSCATALVWRLHSTDADLQPSLHWPEPHLAIHSEPARGPVMVTVEYEVASEDAARFLAEMRELERIRRRDGATLWAVFRDGERAEVFVETFLVESWDEHLRQHARVSSVDLAVEAKVKALHRGAAPPRVRHLLSAGEGSP